MSVFVVSVQYLKQSKISIQCSLNNNSLIIKKLKKSCKIYSPKHAKQVEFILILFFLIVSVKLLDIQHHCF